jgi:GNAT superfamily N-acetyltransferase
VERPSLVNFKEDDSLMHAIRAWVGYIEHSSRKWWVAFTAEGLWVGFAGLEIFDQNSVLLNPCEVKPKARGQGLQTRFIEVRERWAIQNGFTRALSLTNMDNIVSSNNLIKSGYKLRERLPGLSGLGLYWTKDLTPQAASDIITNEAL